MKISSKKQTALNDECTLIKHMFEQNDSEYDVAEVAEEADVFCGVFSVAQSEHYEAAREGLRMAFGIIINSLEDNDADSVVFKDKEYAVERRYQRGDGYTEIYLKEV